MCRLSTEICRADGTVHKKQNSKFTQQVLDTWNEYELMKKKKKDKDFAYW
jgi:hypothetical protein